MDELVRLALNIVNNKLHIFLELGSGVEQDGLEGHLDVHESRLQVLQLVLEHVAVLVFVATVITPGFELSGRSLTEFLETLDLVDAALLSSKLLPTQLTLAVQDSVLLLEVEGLYFTLVLLNGVTDHILEGTIVLVELAAETLLIVQSILVLLQQLLEHVIGLVDVSLIVDGIVRLLGLLLLIVLLLLDLSDSLIVLEFSLVTLRLRNELEIKILEASEHANGEEFVVTVRGASINVRVVLHVENLQVVGQLLEVAHGVIVAAHRVLTEGEHVQLGERIQALNLADLVGVERQVGQLGQLLEALDLGDHVEREVEPREVPELTQVLNLTNDVVIKLQLGQL